MRYCPCHSNIKSISLDHHVISSTVYSVHLCLCKVRWYMKQKINTVLRKPLNIYSDDRELGNKFQVDDLKMTSLNNLLHIELL